MSEPTLSAFHDEPGAATYQTVNVAAALRAFRKRRFVHALPFFEAPAAGPAFVLIRRH
jgi:hypothetical protein